MNYGKKIRTVLKKGCTAYELADVFFIIDEAHRTRKWHGVDCLTVSVYPKYSEIYFGFDSAFCDELAHYISDLERDGFLDDSIKDVIDDMFYDL